MPERLRFVFGKPAEYAAVHRVGRDRDPTGRDAVTLNDVLPGEFGDGEHMIRVPRRESSHHPHAHPFSSAVGGRNVQETEVVDCDDLLTARNGKEVERGVQHIEVQATGVARQLETTLPQDRAAAQR